MKLSLSGKDLLNLQQEDLGKYDMRDVMLATLDMLLSASEQMETSGKNIDYKMFEIEAKKVLLSMISKQGDIRELVYQFVTENHPKFASLVEAAKVMV